MIIAAEPHPFWLYVFIPACTFIVGILGLLVSMYPLLRDRLQKQQVKDEHKEHLDASADWVLGRPGDVARGRIPIVGFVDLVPQLQKKLEELEEKVGDMTTADPSLIELVHSIQQDMRRLAKGRDE